MTHALPMIVAQPVDNRTIRAPSGQKAPLQPKEVWAIRVRLQMARRIRDLALFNLAIDSKLRGCDLVCLKVTDIAQMGEVRPRASVIQKKTGAPVRFDWSQGPHRQMSPDGRNVVGVTVQDGGLFYELDRDGQLGLEADVEGVRSVLPQLEEAYSAAMKELSELEKAFAKVVDE